MDTFQQGSVGAGSTACASKGTAKEKKGKWLSRETIKRMKQRDEAWRKYRKYSSGKNYEEYRKIRNDVNRLVRQDEDMDRKQILHNFKGKPKSFYGYMIERHADSQGKCNGAEER